MTRRQNNRQGFGSNSSSSFGSSRDAFQSHSKPAFSDKNSFDKGSYENNCTSQAGGRDKERGIAYNGDRYEARYDENGQRYEVCRDKNGKEYEVRYDQNGRMLDHIFYQDGTEYLGFQRQISDSAYYLQSSENLQNSRSVQGTSENFVAKNTLGGTSYIPPTPSSTTPVSYTNQYIPGKPGSLMQELRRRAKQRADEESRRKGL